MTLIRDSEPADPLALIAEALRAARRGDEDLTTWCACHTGFDANGEPIDMSPTDVRRGLGVVQRVAAILTAPTAEGLALLHAMACAGYGVLDQDERIADACLVLERGVAEYQAALTDEGRTEAVRVTGRRLAAFDSALESVQLSTLRQAVALGGRTAPVVERRLADITLSVGALGATRYVGTDGYDVVLDREQSRLHKARVRVRATET